MALDLYLHVGLYLWLSRWRSNSSILFPQPVGKVSESLLNNVEEYCQVLAQREDDSSFLDSEDDLDDIHTDELPRVLWRFLLALSMSYTQMSDLGERRIRMIKCQKLVERYCSDVGKILRGEFKDAHSLIAKFCIKGDRASAILRREEIKTLEKAIQIPSDLFRIDNPVRGDEELRSFWIALIRLSFMEAALLYNSLEDEIEMLKLSDEENRRNDGQPPPPPIRVQHLPDPGSVRKHFQSNVFKPSHNLPTMTLDEIVAKEYHQDVEILQAAQKRSEAKYKRRSGENSDDYDSDDSDRGEVFEKTEEEQRAWDDWVDENPRGSGNKMVNRG